jgi:imidazole glycerol-phosphate synthase subunit HisH
MIGIVDYGMGNLRSVQKALEKVGAEASIIGGGSEIEASSKLILPGVGAFGDAMEHLRERGLVEAIGRFVASGRPFLGICLGLQLLFEGSEESPGVAGLGILRGGVVRFRPADRALKVPHMGWNTLDLTRADCPLFAGLPPKPAVYFVHSYHAAPADRNLVAATADYPEPFTAAIWRDNVFATQFHPEKSQRVGMQILKNFAAM